MRRAAIRWLMALFVASVIVACSRSSVDTREVRSVIGDDAVVLLSTAECGFCNRQREDFRAWGVAFREYDVQTSDVGADAYRMLRARGVPIVIVGDERVHGYAPGRVRELLRDAGLLGGR